jgi:hypothetical protein
MPPGVGSDVTPTLGRLRRYVEAGSGRKASAYARAPSGAIRSTTRHSGIARTHMTVAAVVLAYAIGIDTALSTAGIADCSRA